MTFRVVVVFFSRTAKLVTLANVIAEGGKDAAKIALGNPLAEFSARVVQPKCAKLIP